MFNWMAFKTGYLEEHLNLSFQTVFTEKISPTHQENHSYLLIF